MACAAVLPPTGEAKLSPRSRVRELGVAPGVLVPGKLNAITDVAGVQVGHATLDAGDVQTGVTAIVPHGGNLFQEKVPAAIAVGNGFGKLVGVTQVRELGEIETPILLTNTLGVWDGATAAVDYMLGLAGNEEVRSINPVVGETNDGWLNDIRARPLQRAHFLAALESANDGQVAEGSVGAGRGTMAFGYKGGIGTSSRVLTAPRGGHTVGVLVQSNFGGILTVAGRAIGESTGRHPFSARLGLADGSCMIVVATDAPLNARQLQRLARRTFAGMARTGASFSHGSGDYAIAFSTAAEVRRRPGAKTRAVPHVPDARLSALLQAVAEATEEAILNSLTRATPVQGRDGYRADALPLELLVPK